MMALSALRSGVFSALIRTAPPGLTWYCSASRPATNTALPEAEIQVSSELVALLDIAMSPSRPPQPTVEPSVPFDCHTDCWSLCENSLGGSGFATRFVLWYCASVVGWISGPDVELHGEPARVPQRFQSRELRRQRVLQIVGEHLAVGRRQRRGVELRASVGDAACRLAGAHRRESRDTGCS